MSDFKTIDIMNYYFTQEMLDAFLGSDDARPMVASFSRASLPYRAFDADAIVLEMDECGYDKVFVTGLKMFSYLNKVMLINGDVDQVSRAIAKYPGRLIGSASYNPYRIKESLGNIERAVKEMGFKYVYFHSLSFGLRLNDAKLYPCYAKCDELGITVGMQAGHSGEIMPSEPGRPIYIDEVAMDFPGLKIILSHTGWPWVEEVVAMVSKHPNVYCDISAWMPRFLPVKQAALFEFMKSSQGREKVIFGTNGFGLQRCREQFLQLPLSDEVKEKVLFHNAARIFNLETPA